MNNISSDTLMTVGNGIYIIQAKFEIEASELLDEAIVRFKVGGKTTMTKMLQGKYHDDRENWTTFELDPTSLLIESTGETAQAELEITRPDGGEVYYAIDEFSMTQVESHGPHVDTILVYDNAGNESKRNIPVAELTAGPGLQAGGDMQIRFNEPAETVINLDPDSNTIAFYADGHPVVTLNTKSGGVTLDQDFDYPEGAAEFWRSVATAFPMMFETPLIPEPEQSETTNNYDRAMEMFNNG